MVAAILAFTVAKEADLRAVCDDLRRQKVRSIEAYKLPKRRNAGFLGLANSLIAHARRALVTPESEVCPRQLGPPDLRSHRRRSPSLPSANAGFEKRPNVGLRMIFPGAGFGPAGAPAAGSPCAIT